MNMKRVKSSEKGKGVLFATHYIDDKLDETNQVYLFDKLFNQLDISPVLNNYSPEGGSMYSPKEHLSVLLYAYFYGITSSNQIANMLKTHLEFIYLSGGHSISSRAIREFRLKNKETITTLLTQTVELALKIGLINKNDVFSLDGTKIAASASKSKTLSKSAWKERRAAILECIENYMEECKQDDENDDASDLEAEKRERFNTISEQISNLKRKDIAEAIDKSEKKHKQINQVNILDETLNTQIKILERIK